MHKKDKTLIFLTLSILLLCYNTMEQHLGSSVTLFIAAARKRLNQRKISLQDFIAQCKLRNKNKINIFQFAIIVQRINFGSSYFKPKQLFCQINQQKESISMETFRNLFLKASKMSLSDIHLGHGSKQTNHKSPQIPHPNEDNFCSQIQKNNRYYSEIGFNKALQYINLSNSNPQKIFDDCDSNKSGFIDRNEFNKFLFATDIYQFRDKDVRRYLTDTIFQRLKAQRLSKTQFFNVFKLPEKIKNLCQSKNHLKSSQSLKKHTYSAQVQQERYTVKLVKANNQQFNSGNYQSLGNYGYNYPQFQAPGQYESLVNNMFGGYNPYEMFMNANQNNQFMQNPNLFPAQNFNPNVMNNLFGGRNPYEMLMENQQSKNEINNNNNNFNKINPFAPIPILPNQPQISNNDPQNSLQKRQGKKINPLLPQIQNIGLKLPEPPKNIINNINDKPTPPQIPNIQPPKREGKQPQKALQYFRLGAPKAETIDFASELEQLLQSKKVFTDSQNPKIGLDYTYKRAAVLFKTMRFKSDTFSLFALSNEQMNQQRKETDISKLIDANDINQGSVGDCYLLSAIASLAFDFPQILAQKFCFEVNPSSYLVNKLFIDGQWKYIKTDDQFSVVKCGLAAYARPKQNQIWVMLLQKCFAKVFGSYSAIQMGTEIESFFVLTGAITEYIQFESNKNFDFIALKQKLIAADKRGYLMTTSGNQKMAAIGSQNLKKLGLANNHAYSLLKFFQAGDETVLQIRNPWGHFMYSGDWSFQSSKWTPQLRKQHNYQKDIENGIFFMSWQEYVKYFACVTICKLEPTFVHTSFKMINNKRKSNYVTMKVATKGTYHLFICQQSDRKHKADPKYRSSDLRIILLLQNPLTEKYEYIASKYTGYVQICPIQVQLEPGTYIISAKAKWVNDWTDHQCFLVSYGQQYVSFQMADRSIAAKFKEDMIYSYSLACSKKAERKNYYDQKVPKVFSEKYFNIQDGLGYLKISNKGNRNVEIAFKFTLSLTIKVIKPNTSNWKTVVYAGEQKAIGFFLSRGYSYQYTESIAFK